MKPLLSIVIANYNYGCFLEEAIRSVVEQDGFDQCELIIVDGGSTDNSVEVIKKYERKIAWWVSEPDKGQSDAFNKGFAQARGRFLTWLNADDVMSHGALVKICAALKAHPSCEWFTGNFYRFAEDGRIIECAWGPNYLPKCLQSKGQPVAVFGPSTIFTKELFIRMGGMKVEQNFMMDTDLWMRFIVAGVKQRRINCFCWGFRMHEASKTAEFGAHRLSTEQRTRFEAERQRSIEETGYRMNRLNRRLIQLWRVFDGSLLKGLWLKYRFKRVECLSADTNVRVLSYSKDC